MSKWQDMMEKERICVIVPTFNNAGTIVDVLRRIGKITHNIIVVNDGCTDDTHQRILQSGVEVGLVEYAKNRGKGYALRQGFRKAIERGYEYAITIDSDGQHFPEDIPLFLEAHRQHGSTLLVGARTLNPDNMRRGSGFANKFSNFWFNLQTGLHLEDTQSGYRLYPIIRMNPRWIITSRYESELEFLVYSAWKGIEVRNIPIRVYYPPKAERVSHFRPFWDFMRITLLNIVLTTGAICYYLPLKLIRRIHK
ncbi:glycosyltransferase family 2 protein [Prevotella sp. KH2C16]|uniref:glycosyltransferase family 2 protein n=1 Tax=Prevotella sp. KH2C16 TaxID=1855325 RepID=UPI0008E1627F|nr:glycosyltransferase family 2 protein [Prevotella sp. KH2C16]SFF92273.1 Glycosyltransferase involved in cell wall bisynthesis [Prevotella sp. KH2C16]